MAGGLVIAFIAFIVISLMVRMGGQEEVASAPAENADYANTVLLVRDREGGINQILLFVPDDVGGRSLYIIPPQTILDVPGAGFQKLNATLDSGNYETLTQALEGLFGFPIDNYIEVSWEALEDAVARAGIINFKSEERIQLGEDVSLDTGDNMISSNRTLSYLEAAQNSPQYLPKVQAMFYSGLTEAIAQKTEHELTEAAASFAGKTKGNLGKENTSHMIFDMMDQNPPTSVVVLPVIISGSGDDWYYEPVPSQIEAMLNGSNLNASFDLEIRNGTETEGMVEAASATLEPLRYNMKVSADASEVNYDHTQIRCGSDALEQCNSVQKYLGIGTVIKDELLEKSQIILILGKDYKPGNQ